MVAVDGVAGDLVGEIRAGAGPRLILAETYRLKGHTTADPEAYRSADEVAAHAENEPVARCRTLLHAMGVAEIEVAAAEAEARAEMGQSVATAEASPWPDASLAFTDVQDIGAA